MIVKNSNNAFGNRSATGGSLRRSLPFPGQRTTIRPQDRSAAGEQPEGGSAGCLTALEIFPHHKRATERSNLTASYSLLYDLIIRYCPLISYKVSQNRLSVTGTGTAPHRFRFYLHKRKLHLFATSASGYDFSRWGSFSQDTTDFRHRRTPAWPPRSRVASS